MAKRKSNTKQRQTPQRPQPGPRPQPTPSGLPATYLPLATYVRLAERLAAERTRERWRHTPGANQAELDAERELHAAALDVRSNFAREIDEWLYAHNQPRWSEMSWPEQDRTLMRWMRHATAWLSKKRSGETRSGRTVPAKNFLKVFDDARKKFPSNKATIRYLAGKPVFTDAKGRKVSRARATIYLYLPDDRKTKRKKKEPPTT